MPHRRHSGAHLFFLGAFALLVALIHLPFLDLPFHWDEAGQFIPAAMDLYQKGLWVPHSATPNIHPSGLMAYLALVWKVFGYSVVATRGAMLALAALALWVVFLLAIRLCRKSPGAPAFAAVLLVLVTPVFYTQAMLAQLDLPAMLLSCAALLLFLEDRIRWAALAAVALVLVKETGIVVPVVLGAWLLFERRGREAAWFLLPFAALGAWLAVLFHVTGTIFGNAAFGRYNVEFPLHPVRLAVALARRGFYLFVDQFHWLGWIAVAVAWRRARLYRSREWMVALAVGVAEVLAVTALGGATLERYLLPALPIMYIAFAAAWSAVPTRWMRINQAGVFAGLLLFLFWNPPYPYPFENNLAMVDFVRLHESAATFLDHDMPGAKVTTAWPLSVELRRPYLGYVNRRMTVSEIPSFQPADIGALDPRDIDVFVLFSRDWEGHWDPRRLPALRGLMRRFYGYTPQVTPKELEKTLHLSQVARWDERGQWIAVFKKRPE